MSERTLLRSDFSLQKNQSHAPSFLLFRKKARSARLFACKRAHNGSQSLPPFCEYACGVNISTVRYCRKEHTAVCSFDIKLLLSVDTLDHILEHKNKRLRISPEPLVFDLYSDFSPLCALATSLFASASKSIRILPFGRPPPSISSASISSTSDWITLLSGLAP